MTKVTESGGEYIRMLKDWVRLLLPCCTDTDNIVAMIDEWCAMKKEPKEVAQRCLVESPGGDHRCCLPVQHSGNHASCGTQWNNVTLLAVGLKEESEGDKRIAALEKLVKAHDFVIGKMERHMERCDEEYAEQRLDAIDRSLGRIDSRLSNLENMEDKEVTANALEIISNRLSKLETLPGRLKDDVENLSASIALLEDDGNAAEVARRVTQLEKESGDAAQAITEESEARMQSIKGLRQSLVAHTDATTALTKRVYALEQQRASDIKKLDECFGNVDEKINHILRYRAADKQELANMRTYFGEIMATINMEVPRTSLLPSPALQKAYNDRMAKVLASMAADEAMPHKKIVKGTAGYPDTNELPIAPDTNPKADWTHPKDKVVGSDFSADFASLEAQTAWMRRDKVPSVNTLKECPSCFGRKGWWDETGTKWCGCDTCKATGVV